MNGADVNVLSKDEISPLQYACRESHDELAKLLIRHNANLAQWGQDCSIGGPLKVESYDNLQRNIWGEFHLLQIGSAGACPLRNENRRFGASRLKSE